MSTMKRHRGLTYTQLRFTKERVLVSLVIHPHALKHGLTEDNIRNAWDNFVKRVYRGGKNENDQRKRACRHFLTRIPIVTMIGLLKGITSHTKYRDGVGICSQKSSIIGAG